MSQFLNVVSHGQHARDVKKGLSRCSAERPRYQFYHLVLDSLEHIDESFGSSSEVPELAAVGQNREADSIEYQSPIGHRQAPDRIAEYLERFDGRTCSVTHDPYVWFPLESALDEEPEISQVFRRPHNVIGGVLSIRKDQLQGSRERVALIGLLEE